MGLISRVSSQTYRDSRGTKMSITFIQAQELYNVLNQLQSGKHSQLSDPNYLFLIDARAMADYHHFHIPTAIRPRAKASSDGTTTMILPYEPMIECKQRIVVYDGNSKELTQDVQRPAVRVATALSRAGAQVPIEVLYGGFEQFSAQYPFMRTTKTMYTPRELDNFCAYPIEILSSVLYLGNNKQAADFDVRKNLKLTGFIMFHASEDAMKKNTVELPETLRQNGDHIMHIIESSKIGADTMKSCAKFIDRHQISSDRVLVTCDSGRAISAAAAVHYLMHRSGSTVTKDQAISNVQCCKTDIFTKGPVLRQL